MRWLNWLAGKAMWKVVHGSKLPKASLRSCLLNLARRGFEPREIVDVGAHKAKWSAVARKVFPHAGYTLIEPQEEMREHLQRFCGQRDNCRYFLAGAGSQSGALPLTICPDSSASNFMSNAAQAKQRGGHQRIVPIVTLDHLVTEHIHRIPDLVKVDAEGFEQEVVKGAKSLLGKTELFFLEAHFLSAPDDPSYFATLVEFMAQRGYVPYDFSWFGKHPTDGSLFLCEIVFALENGVLRAAHAKRYEASRLAA